MLFEIQALKKEYIVSASAGSRDLEIITTLEALGIQFFSIYYRMFGIVHCVFLFATGKEDQGCLS